MIRAMLGVLVGVSSAAAGALAQTTGNAAVAPGERIRLTMTGAAEGHWQRGTVGRVSGDTLWLDASADTRAVPLGAIERLEVSHGTRAHVLLGMGVGVVAGAALGGALGLASGGDPPCNNTGRFWEGFASCAFRLTAGEKAELAAIALGSLGAIVGAMAGAAIRTERWVPTRRAGLRVTAGMRGGVGVGLSYRF